MDELEIDSKLMPMVVTAIADYDFESFVASTLFSQGWSVIYRALDFKSLDTFLESSSKKDLLIIYSPDLPGLTPAALSTIQRAVPRVIGIESRESNPEYLDIHPRPQQALELINLVRGNLRAPMVRIPMQERLEGKKAYIHSFASIGPATGCTTIAMNFAAELSELGRKVLLIDANASAPAVATYFEMRNLNARHGYKKLSETLFAVEISQKNLADLIANLELASSEFDEIILDLGSIMDLQSVLTDRRWASQCAIWSSNHADEITFVTTPELLPSSRLRNLVSALPRIAFRSKLSFALNQRTPGKRGNLEEEVFLATVTPLKPHALYLLPADTKSLLVAKRERKVLLEVNERSALRKAIFDIASQKGS